MNSKVHVQLPDGVQVSLTEDAFLWQVSNGELPFEGAYARRALTGSVNKSQHGLNNSSRYALGDDEEGGERAGFGSGGMLRCPASLQGAVTVARGPAFPATLRH